MKLWIARDQNSDLFLYPIKPDRYSDLFPEVTFENSPMEVELKLIENGNLH